MAGNEVVDKIVVQLDIEEEQFYMKLRKLHKEMSVTTKVANVTKQTFSSFFSKMKEAMDRFPAWALGIMFFGQSIKRTFESIATVGVKTFQDIMHSVEGTVTPLDILSGIIDLIKFSIGSAISSVLEPFVGLITEIGIKIFDWINNNKELVGEIILVGIAVGTILAIFGSLVLAGYSIITMIKAVSAMFSFLNSSFLTAITSMFGAGALLVPIITMIAVIAASLVAFFILWKSNLGEIQEYFKNTLGIIWGFIVRLFNRLWNIAELVIGIIVDLFTGNWDKAIEKVWILIKELFSLIVDAMATVGAVLANTLIFVFNLAKDIILNTIIGGIFSAIKKGLDLIGLDTWAAKVARAENAIKGFSESLTIEYISPENTEAISTGDLFAERQVKGNTTVINNYNVSSIQTELEISRFSSINSSFD